MALLKPIILELKLLSGILIPQSSVTAILSPNAS